VHWHHTQKQRRKERKSRESLQHKQMGFRRAIPGHNSWCSPRTPGTFHNTRNTLPGSRTLKTANQRVYSKIIPKIASLIKQIKHEGSGTKPLDQPNIYRLTKNRCFRRFQRSHNASQDTRLEDELGDDKNTRDREEPRCLGQRPFRAPYSCHWYTDRDSSAR